MIDLVIDFDSHESKLLLYENLKELEGKKLIKIDTPYNRSYDFDKYYWGVIVKYISNSTGNDPLKVHTTLADRFLAITKDVRLSTAGLNNEEFEVYTTQCRNWALEVLKITIPLPDSVIYDQNRKY